jgi:hypothetical protein
MAKIFANINQKPGAWIVDPEDKGRKSIKSGKCFLKNNSYFEIELFNPLSVSVLSDIKLNGQSISKTGLVVKPGQRVYLDCFIDDKKKFIFSTYDIDGSQESLDATEKNGLLEVFFYKEDVITLSNWKSNFDKVIVEKWYVYPNYNPYNIWHGITPPNFNITSSNSTTTNFGNVSNSLYSSNSSITPPRVKYSNSPIETGRVERGEASKQQFTKVDMDFEKNYISSTIIQILPESRKPAEVSAKLRDHSKSESDEVLELIQKLSDLHKSGILTDEEFSEKKTELLSKI